MGVCSYWCKEKSSQIIDPPPGRISTRTLNQCEDADKSSLKIYVERNERQMIQKIRNIFSVILNDDLTEVEVIRDRLVQRQAKFLSVSLRYCKNLLVLNLRNNDLGNAGIKIIAPIFKFTKNLQTLIIEDNHIRGEGISDICKTLHNLSNLEILSLSQNYLGQAVNDLANVFIYLPMLKELYMQVMDITSEDFIVLSLQICGCSKLERLGLGHNKIDLASLKALNILIKSLGNLKELIISGIQIPETDLDNLIINNTNIKIVP
jgi:Ran GTPase-activating protein (RanGAP) involved in mRNA processing and transport